MSAFDEWFSSKFELVNKVVTDNEHHPATTFKRNMGFSFEAGAQSRQAEIDEYKEVAESMEDAYLREKSKVDELQKRIDDALKAMDGESVNSWGLWKEKGDMYEQGASNAYEKSYWILKGTTNEH